LGFPGKKFGAWTCGTSTELPGAALGLDAFIAPAQAVAWDAEARDAVELTAWRDIQGFAVPVPFGSRDRIQRN